MANVQTFGAPAWRPPDRVRLVPTASPGALLAIISGVILLVLVGMPVAAILARALGSGQLVEAAGRPVVVEALRLSLMTTVVTLVGSVLLGTPVAFALARRSFPGRALLDSLLELPIVIPPAVAGIGLLLAFGRRGILGPYLADLGITVGFTTTAVVLAQLFVAAPFYVRAARVGFVSMDRDPEEAARIDGASEWAVFRFVTAPMCFPALLTGAVLCWARALGEFGATIMFAGSFQGRTQTMPLAIYAALEADLEAALALSAVLTVVAFATLGILRRVLGRTVGAEG